MQKPQPPNVPLGIWKALYAEADNFAKLRPWETLDDRDLVAVRDSATGQTGYGVYLGSAGELFGFAVYRGPAGYASYRKLIKRNSAPMNDDLWATMDALKLELVTKEEMEPSDRKIVERLGLTYRGEIVWPQFRAHAPGYAEWYLDEQEAAFLTFAIRAAREHCERFCQGLVGETIRGKQVLMYHSQHGKKELDSVWEAQPKVASVPVVHVIPDPKRVATIFAKLPRKDSPWEVGTFYIPSVILDRDRPYYTRLAVACHVESGHIFQSIVGTPNRSEAELLTEVLLASIQSSRFIPEEVVVGDKSLAKGLGPISKTMGFSIRAAKSLPGIRKLRKEIIHAAERGLF